MATICIIQARMGSTRLPGKVLADIGGMSMLARVVRRVRRATLLDDIVIATTIDPTDEAIVDECQRLSVAVIRGSVEDVLDRYYQVAQTYHADAIVRITSDCPLIEPELIDQVITSFQETQADYASNCIERRYPRGLDVEVMRLTALKYAWEHSESFYQRAHVTPFIYQNSHLFRIVSVTGDEDYSSYRWTVDTPEDLAFVRAIYERLDNTDNWNWRKVLSLLEQEPALIHINQHITQKDLLQG